MEIAVLSDPTNLILLGISILCILIGATFFVGNATEGTAGKGGLIQRAKSLVDMSASLLQEERRTAPGTGTASGTTTKTDNRVLHPIEFRPFRVLKTVKLNHNTKLIRFEIPHGRSLGLTIGKHISIQAHINGNRVRPLTSLFNPFILRVNPLLYSVLSLIGNESIHPVLSH